MAASVSHSSDAPPRTDAEAIEVTLPEPDPERSFRARRSAQLTNWAAFSTRPIGLLLTWFVILGLMRSVWRLASKAPALAGDELGAALAVAGRSRRVRAARRRLAQHTKVPASALGRLYATAAEIRGVRVTAPARSASVAPARRHPASSSCASSPHWPVVDAAPWGRSWCWCWH